VVVAALTALLLIMALAELFKPEADRLLTLMVSALLGVDTVDPEAVATHVDGTVNRLLDAARQDITPFVDAGSEKPPLSGAVRTPRRPLPAGSRLRNAARDRPHGEAFGRSSVVRLSRSR
jgi:hypothetical protein